MFRPIALNENLPVRDIQVEEAAVDAPLTVLAKDHQQVMVTIMIEQFG